MNADANGLDGYYVVLNVYTSDVIKPNGHFGICIFSDDDPSGTVSFYYKGKEFTWDGGLYMSYSGDKVSVDGLVKVYAVSNIPDKQKYPQSTGFVICRGITHENLTMFTTWFRESFCGRIKGNIWMVSDERFEKYDGSENSKSYCGAVATTLIHKLIENVPSTNVHIEWNILSHALINSARKVITETSEIGTSFCALLSYLKYKFQN